MSYKRLGDYIQLVDNRNKDLAVTNLLGINIFKNYMPSVANQTGLDLSKYKVVSKGQFATNLMHVNRDEVLPVALYTDEEPALVSPAYKTFEVIDKTAPYIDGVLFEDFTTGYDFKNKKAYYWKGNDLDWINSQGEKLKNLKEKYGLVILTLDYVNDEEMAKKCVEHAKEYGFIPMTTDDINLNSI